MKRTKVFNAERGKRSITLKSYNLELFNPHESRIKTFSEI